MHMNDIVYGARFNFYTGRDSRWWHREGKSGNELGKKGIFSLLAVRRFIAAWHAVETFCPGRRTNVVAKRSGIMYLPAIVRERCWQMSHRYGTASESAAAYWHF